ncbi:MAG: DUF4384 domain-containing protein [Desulfobacterales bacterium]|nr:DUF4384 domain-containing protein [Desulfobacterales bacterium]
MQVYMKRLFIILIFIAFNSSVVDAGRKTRDLVFDDEEASSPPKNMPKMESGQVQSVVAIKTTIELERNGQLMDVSPNYEFQSGDRIKIVYTPNIDSYVYWLCKGSSGEYSILFPNAKTGMDNYIRKNQEHVVPVKGGFRFDKTPGVEKITLMMSPNRIPDLDEAAKESVIKNTKQVDGMVEQHKSKRKTRDLVFDEEEDTSKGVMTVKQGTTDIKQPFVMNYELKHN